MLATEKPKRRLKTTEKLIEKQEAEDSNAVDDASTVPSSKTKSSTASVRSSSSSTASTTTTTAEATTKTPGSIPTKPPPKFVSTVSPKLPEEPLIGLQGKLLKFSSNEEVLSWLKTGLVPSRNAITLSQNTSTTNNSDAAPEIPPELERRSNRERSSTPLPSASAVNDKYRPRSAVSEELKQSMQQESNRVFKNFQQPPNPKFLTTTLVGAPNAVRMRTIFDVTCFDI